MFKSHIEDCNDCIQYHERTVRLFSNLEMVLRANPTSKKTFTDIFVDVTPEQGSEKIGRGRTRSCPFFEIEVSDVEAAKAILSKLLGVTFYPSPRYAQRKETRFWDATWLEEVISVYS